MGIKTFLGNLFGSSDQQMPSSLGQEKTQETKADNLGNNIHQEKEASQMKEAADQTSQKEETSKATENKATESKTEDKKQSAPACATYNLIILDESGSMFHVRQQTISGCNETLNSIRNTAKEQPQIKQYVSIFCFDNQHSRYIFQNVPIEETRDLTPEDYKPNGCTPLYDAIGYTVTQLRSFIAGSDSVGVVTILTDGYENASRKWYLQSVVDLIASLKKQGWVFTFIGANIDVEKTARGMGIDSFVEFEQSDTGMKDMFEKERLSRRAYNTKRSYMRSMTGFADMPCEERKMMYASMNHNYFVDKVRIAPDYIQSLNSDEIFVFGSNVLGQHTGGAALYAIEHFGAIDRHAEGLQGQSYAIPTHGCTFEELKDAVARFTKFVVMHPQNKFMLTAIGCGAAGYSVEQIAPFFRQVYSFGNVYVPKAFLPFMSEDDIF